MDRNDKLHRIQILKDRHKHIHSLVEALEAERAPEEFITKTKKEKLKLKDEIVSIEKELNQGIL